MSRVDIPDSKKGVLDKMTPGRIPLFLFIKVLQASSISLVSRLNLSLVEKKEWMSQTNGQHSPHPIPSQVNTYLNLNNLFG